MWISIHRKASVRNWTIEAINSGRWQTALEEANTQFRAVVPLMMVTSRHYTSTFTNDSRREFRKYWRKGLIVVQPCNAYWSSSHPGRAHHALIPNLLPKFPDSVFILLWLSHTNTTHRAPLLYIQQHCLCGVQTVNRYTLSLSKSSGNRNVEVDNNIYIIVVFLIIIGVISLGTEAPVMSCNN